jgi:hypothetical protein
MHRPASVRIPLTILASAMLLAVAAARVHAAEGGFRQPMVPPGEQRSQTVERVRGQVRDRVAERDRDDDRDRHRTPQQDASSTVINYRGMRLVFSDGNWYRQEGDDLVATRPPSGMMVRELPAEHALRWVAGVPYFYANGLYYVWRERQKQYEVLQEPPAGSEPATRESEAARRAGAPSSK